MKSGWANCSTLFWIDTHELPLGSIPPVAPALAILFCRIGAECCRGQDAYKSNDSDDRDCAQRPPEMAIRVKDAVTAFSLLTSDVQ